MTGALAASPYFVSASAPELQQMAGRMARCRALFPKVWAKFWRFEGVVCVQCGKAGDFAQKRPDGTGQFNIGVLVSTESAAYRALSAGGLDALYYTDIEPGEIWFGWCNRCPTPQTPEAWERLTEAARRRAAPPDAPGQ